eukprot:c16154_g1_i1.p2 GENE.c16154_g1_i1~~c16154_g1_i1.p2  ORF type:complete len:197 (-),score=15.00 c16154_g1_i1:67-657(-)
MSARGYCAVHSKSRNQECLAETMPGSGVFSCIAGFECKAAAATNTATKPLCQVHGKKRSTDTLVDTWTPTGIVFQCRPGMECKMGSARFHPYNPAGAIQGVQAFQPLAMPQIGAISGMGSAAPADHGTCLAHGRQRGAAHLIPHPSIIGGFMCRPDRPCKVPEVSVPSADTPALPPIQEGASSKKTKKDGKAKDKD